MSCGNAIPHSNYIFSRCTQIRMSGAYNSIGNGTTIVYLVPCKMPMSNSPVEGTPLKFHLPSLFFLHNVFAPCAIDFLTGEWGACEPRCKQLLLSRSSHIARRSSLRDHPKTCLCSSLDELYAGSHVSVRAHALSYILRSLRMVST